VLESGLIAVVSDTEPTGRKRRKIKDAWNGRVGVDRGERACGSDGLGKDGRSGDELAVEIGGVQIGIGFKGSDDVVPRADEEGEEIEGIAAELGFGRVVRLISRQDRGKSLPRPRMDGGGIAIPDGIFRESGEIRDE
jgi:hypothetical protein